MYSKIDLLPLCLMHNAQTVQYKILKLVSAVCASSVGLSRYSGVPSPFLD